MIKIQEHLNRDDSEAFLDSLAEDHWNALNPRVNKGKDYSKRGLVEKCKKYEKQTRLQEYRVKYAKNDRLIANRHTAFFSYLIKSKAIKLKQIIVARPDQFTAIKSEILNILHPEDLFFLDSGKNKQTPFGSLLSDTIFNYTAFRGSDFCKETLSKIGFKYLSCPYCNDNRVSIITLRTNSSTETKLKAYLDLDHFYCKSQHPFFAVSFFNLIPTCHSCNSSDKGDKLFTTETHIHPYHENFDNYYEFRIPIKSLLGSMLGDPINIIDIVALPHKRADRTLIDLNLADRYNADFSQAQALVDFFLNYRHLIKTSQENVFIDGLFKSNGGVPKGQKEILRHSKGKMSRDILKQLDIHNILGLV